MGLYSLVYDSAGKLIESGKAGTVWGSPAAMKAFAVKEVELSRDQICALEQTAKGQGGDGLTKTAGVLLMEECAANKTTLDALIQSAVAETLKAQKAGEAPLGK